MTNIKIKTKGMHCPSCEMLVKDALQELDGIRETKADHKKGIVEVEFDSSRADFELIKHIIEKEGYKVE